MKERFHITGMTCSSCSNYIEKTMIKLDGVKFANVNLLSNSLIVEYDEKIIKNKKIINTVKSIGYGIYIEGNNKKNSKEQNEDEEISNMKKRLIISLVFLIPIMYLSMQGMLYHMFHIPIPEIVKNIFGGIENSVIFIFTQFILLLPIIFVNQKYFKVGFKALWKKNPNMDTLVAIRKYKCNFLWSICNF